MVRITDKTLEIACRIPSDNTVTENTIHDLSFDLRDARARISELEAALLRAIQELALWDHSCTGKHGSQTPCHITPVIGTMSTDG